ncbi:TPA: hypothetical protein N0F65_003700 [Lagenidium giganteum]|uniref:Kazal-like domain-containing protein n=1 Tax=Lagenidium giganteum TaxID=4803 RepID=A0AAV2YST4_9STRA|nr:TPA: hypothetical protein N0F65_003700 [Lagenidium giganteum]
MPSLPTDFPASSKLTMLAARLLLLLAMTATTTVHADFMPDPVEINCAIQRTCTDDESLPVCASDAKTYNNQCQYETAYCNTIKTGATKLFVLHDGACTSTDDRLCNLRCSNVADAPVCGTDGNTYANECQLEAAQCTNPSLVKDHDGACAPTLGQRGCTLMCINVDKPVCGSDGVTYSNDCQLKHAQCANPAITKVSDSACPVATPSPTPTPPQWCEPHPCTFIYKPVCGSDGATYGNKCMLKQEACKNPRLRLVSEGACPTPTPAPHCSKKSCKGDGVVCGSDGVTYDSMCAFNDAQCANPSLSLVSTEACVLPKACLTVKCSAYQVCRFDDASQSAYCADTCARGRCKQGELAHLVPVLAVALSAVRAGVVEIDCSLQRNCLRTKNPICASDRATYRNQCEFEKAFCRAEASNTVFSKLYDGECCVGPCPKTFDPVCGSHGVTYDNSCEFYVAQCRDDNIKSFVAGACGFESDLACPKSLLPNPQCGSDGLTYPNTCVFQLAQRTKPTLTLAYGGKCDPCKTFLCPSPQPYAGKGGIDCSAQRKCSNDLIDPVCGSDFTTYNNNCQYENAYCGAKANKKTLSKLHDGVCCPDACAEVLKPVCGSDGKTYNNECEFFQAQCNDHSLKFCKPAQASVSGCKMAACVRMYDPQCGSDGTTYGNKCEFNNAKCTKPDLKLAYAGECDPCKNYKCAQFQQCKVDDGTSKPYCADVCAEGRCRKGQKCELQQLAQLILTLTAAVATVSAATSAAIDCPQFCPMDYEPVCGTNRVTYSNKCQLLIAQCKDATIRLDYEDECTCEDVCPDIYDPYCGSDGVTYPNSCVLNNTKCTNATLFAVYRGSCDPCRSKTCNTRQLCRPNEVNGKGYCADTCAASRCKKTEVCQLQQVLCLRDPCPPRAICKSAV